MKRGDVVIVEFPYTDGRASKIRPALVVQNNDDNTRLRDTVVALITGNISRANEATHCLIDPRKLEGASSGLHGSSCVLCGHLYTVRQSLVIQIAGTLPGTMMQQVDNSLKAALDL